MVKYIINDYFIRLNPRNVKKEDLRFLPIYIWCFLMCIESMEVDKGIFFCSYMTSAMIGMAFSYLCGRTLPKIFYLLPMSKEERQQYVTIGFNIRLLIPQIIYCLWAGVIFLFNRINLLDYLTGFGMLLICNAAVQTASAIIKVDEFIGAFQFFARFVMLGGFFIYYAIYEGRVLKVLSATANRTLLIIWYVVVVALLVVIVKYTIRDYKNMVRKAASYEYTN